ncbi:Fpg/Nei family DNA glycosylase [Allobranchiibius huperziae]|uniref:DNA-(apurinic or apyrimidinic site) lyase n=1 Tax=Allobranchiibius huperziae TaxID=1874116 RepID=A0A853DED7_9MICO|nr:endonuclease-8 [Allobranchiibius huperziae]
MPEGDVVWKAADRLNAALRDQPLVGAELRWPGIPDRPLHGMVTTGVHSRGKHLLHRLDSGLTIHSHLRMEGSWRVRPTPQVTPRFARAADIRALLATQEWAAIGWRLGMLDLIATGDEHRLVGHLGPDILGADWDPEEAVRRLLRAPDLTIGEALLDQRNLAGIGTFFAAEALFARRLNPWTAVGDLGPDEVRALIDVAQKQLAQSAHDPSRSLTQRTGLLDDNYVHGRSGLPCERCGTLIRVAMIGKAPQDRTMFYCPHCQGGLGPTDDGKRQRPIGR